MTTTCKKQQASLSSVELVKLLKKSIPEFNRYRADHPNEILELKGANLLDAKLTNVDLRNTDLTGAILSFADLRCANLEGANLTDATLFFTDFRCANLDKVKIDAIAMKNCSVYGAKMAKDTFEVYLEQFIISMVLTDS